MYDGHEVKKEFYNRRFEGAFEVSIRYLYEKLLDALLVLRKKKDVYFDLCINIGKARMLYERSLFHESLKILADTIKQAQYYEMNEIVVMAVKHDVIIPYLRMWVGPMDYTPGAMLNTHSETFYDNQHEPMNQGTRSHQLAMYVVYASPLQMVSDSPSKYDENPESFEFIKSTPAIWDETVPLAGEVGEYIVVVRCSGDTWFVGALNGENPRDIQVDLSFIVLVIRASGLMWME